MKDAENFDGVSGDSIGNDVRRIGDDEFACAGDSAWASHGGILACCRIFDLVVLCYMVLREAITL